MKTNQAARLLRNHLVGLQASTKLLPFEVREPMLHYLADLRSAVLVLSLAARRD